MSPHPTALLGLVLCLAQTIHTQEEDLPRPSISAEPGTVIPLGSHVTFVCRGPVGVQTFRLERESRSTYNDTEDVSQASPSESEARFRIDSVSEGNAGPYRCIYYKPPKWSEQSDYLELLVKETSGGRDSPDTEPGSSAGTVPGTEASGFDAPRMRRNGLPSCELQWGEIVRMSNRNALIPIHAYTDKNI
ncbi:leukocyte-associated immunoglobulin-like receptor 1 isoform X3 [Homo sapiens]|uniref:leukocyte-associated immunoglobulin-like receptor 1 isoform X3 n=1 Tax=Homo sapiens TaxID=9606 RepID=UPI000387BCE7|nr:leukocyte-associated immunoglobulin-like receptor 1 isoform X3 [Homo sapiens]